LQSTFHAGNFAKVFVQCIAALVVPRKTAICWRPKKKIRQFRCRTKRKYENIMFWL